MKIYTQLKHVYFFLLIISFGLSSLTTNAQSMGLNNATPAASSILDLTATNRGLLIPRMTTVQRDAISLPAIGLEIYNTTTNRFNFYDGAWKTIASGSSSTSLDVPNGGTGLTSGISGGILGFTTTGTLTSSPLLNANALVIGGGVGATPTTLALGTANQILTVNSSGTAYTHRLIRSTLSPNWGIVNLAASVTNLQLVIPVAGGAQVATGSRVQMPNGGIITGIIVSGNAACTAGSATFTIFNNGSATAATGVINPTAGTNQFIATSGGTAVFVAGNILDVRVTTTSTWLPTTAEWTAFIVVAFTD